MKAVERSADLNLAAIATKCVTASRRLDYASDDEITLLRLARTLKGVNRDLLGIMQRSSTAGAPADLSEARAMLAAMETHLRAVLLDKEGLKVSQIYHHLVRAVSRAVRAIEFLTGPASDSPI